MNESSGRRTILVDQATKSELRPRGVKIRVASQLLGGKSRAGIYEAVEAGRLDMIKDGKTSLITLDSIDRYMSSLPRARIGRRRAASS
jgi:hypothetical protein